MYKVLKKKNIIAIFLIISFFSLTAVISTNFYTEPSYVRANTGYFDKYASKIGLTEKSKIHREFDGGAAGDAIQYIMIAMGKDDLSHTPYTYRILVPKLAGFLAKATINKDVKNYEDVLFKRISFIWRGINISLCFLLMIIPILHFYKFIFYHKLPFEFPLVLMMNVFNMGVIMTAPFSMLDIPTYAVLTLGASFFFKKDILLLTLTACIGVFVKEITLILMLPILHLCWFQFRKNYILSLFCLFFPIILFLIFRVIISGDASDMGQLRYNVANPLDFYYFKRHVFELGIGNFLTRVFFSIGLIFLIFVFYRIWLRKLKKEFLMILILTTSVIILNLLLASAVIRVTQVVTPFLIFYVLETIRLKQLNLKK